MIVQSGLCLEVALERKSNKTHHGVQSVLPSYMILSRGKGGEVIKCRLPWFLLQGTGVGRSRLAAPTTAASSQWLRNLPTILTLKQVCQQCKAAYPSLEVLSHCPATPGGQRCLVLPQKPAPVRGPCIYRTRVQSPLFPRKGKSLTHNDRNHTPFLKILNPK